MQLVYSGKAHPRDLAGKALVGRLVEAAKKHPAQVVFLENYDMTLGALLTRGADVWLNNPRRPLEASGTSRHEGGDERRAEPVDPRRLVAGGLRARRDRLEDRRSRSEATIAFDEKDEARVDKRDRELLHRVLEREVLPAYGDRAQLDRRSCARSIAMSQWQFSSDRMIEDYVVASVYSGR